MLKDGLPLEGAIKELSKNMGRGKLKTELQLLGEDLEKGRTQGAQGATQEETLVA